MSQIHSFRGRDGSPTATHSGRADNIDTFHLASNIWSFIFIVSFFVNLKRFVLHMCTALGAKRNMRQSMIISFA